MDAILRPYDRTLSKAVITALADTPVVCLLGPRQCGKSTLVRGFTPGRAYVTLDDEETLAAARHDPAGFISALPDPVVLDEVQRVPELLRVIKLTVDRDRRPGRFLLTGSANLLMLPRLGDSLAGRMEVIQLHPLTESEKARAPGGFLRKLLSGGFKAAVTGAPAPPPALLAARLIAGGYPEPLTRTPERARQWRRQYLRSLMERDVRDVARVADPGAVARLLEALALRNAELLNVSGLGGELGLSRATVDHYLAVLERMFLIRRLPAWHRNEAKRLVKSPKIHIPDSGLAATLAGLAAGDWISRRERFGHLLESFVAQQLIAQAGWTDPDLRFWHYRDKDQVEVDLIITRGRQTWGIEVKASSTVTPSDGQGLRRLGEQCGRDFQGGILLHAGTGIYPMKMPHCQAVSIEQLWRC